MQVSIENQEGLKRLITVTVPADEVSKAFSDELRKVAKSARIDGFRKGHIPTAVLLKHFGASMTGEVAEQLVGRSLYQAISDHKLPVPGMPEVDFSNGMPVKGQDFTFKAVVEVDPEVKLKPLSELKVKAIKSEVTDADLDKMIETLRHQQGKWQVKDNAVAGKESLVKIDFVGRVDGKEFEGGKASDFSLPLGAGRMIPGFSEQIVGHKAGDKFTIKVKFPDDYHAENLKGKDAEFDITVNSVSEQVLPEVNADFAKLYGITDGNLDTLRQDLRRNMERELTRVIANKTRDGVTAAIAEAYGEFEIPAARVQAEIKHMKEVYTQRFHAIGITKVPDLKDDIFAADAKKNACVELVLSEIIKQADLKQPSEASIEAQLDLIAGAYENPEEVKKQLRSNQEEFRRVSSLAFEHDVIQYILKQANAQDEHLTFDQLIHPEQAQA